MHRFDRRVQRMEYMVGLRTERDAERENHRALMKAVMGDPETRNRTCALLEDIYRPDGRREIVQADVDEWAAICEQAVEAGAGGG